MEIYFWTSKNGQNPILKFLEGLSQLEAKSIMDTITNLNKFGYLSMMKSGELKKMAGYDLYELRIRWQNNRYRILCALKHKACFILCIFLKKKGKTPPKELKTAMSRLNSIDWKLIKEVVN